VRRACSADTGEPISYVSHIEALNCAFLDSASGIRHVFVHGPYRVSASIEFKCLSYEFAHAYEEFILRRARLGSVPFKMSCPPHVDFGLGMGVGIPEAYYSGGASMKDIIKARGDSGLLFDIELPYMFVREVDA